MRSKLLGIFLLLSSFSFGQYVPDTETFSLQDVVTAVSPTTDDQVACFLEAEPTYFNQNYNNDLYAPISSLLRFRDYGAHNALGFETYVAPDDFDPDAQPVNIYEVFKDYYKENHDAKWIYSVTDATTKTKPTGGTSYYYGYDSAGVAKTKDLASGDSVMWIAGATKKWVITNHTSTTAIVCTLTGMDVSKLLQNQGADWLYCGDKISEVNTSIALGTVYRSYIKHIHISELNNITSYGSYGHRSNTNLVGTLHISESATYIHKYCFYSTGITGVLNVPSNITQLNTSSFGSCSGLTSVILNEGLQTIYNNSFDNCSNINGEIIYPTTLTLIDDYAFLNCTKLDSATFQEGLITIDQYAFQNCTDLDCPLTFPSTLTTIGYGAFLGCTGLNCTLDIPSGLTSIGEAAFGNTNFTDIDESNTNYLVYDSVLYQLSPDTLALHSVKSATDSLELLANTGLIGDYCFYNNLRTDTLVIPDNVTRVGDYAFNNCDGFTAISFETATSELMKIESYAFYDCNNMAGSLDIPDNVTIIGVAAFQNCISITSILLGSSLVTISGNAFRNMTSVTGNIVIPNSVETINYTAFYGNTSTAGTLTLGTGLKVLEYGAFATTPFTGTLNIPASLTTIGGWAFWGNNFSSISSSATKFPVYDNVLYDSVSVSNIAAIASAMGYSGTLTLKTGTTKIQDRCFRGNLNRTGTLNILNTVTSIGEYAFTNCTGFTSATIGDCTNGSSLTTIVGSAFAGCSNITSWEIYHDSSKTPTQPSPTCVSGSFGSYAKPLYIRQTNAPTGFATTPATNAAPWTNTAIFSAVNYTLCP